MSLIGLRRFEEAKSVLRKMMPVARRVLGESHELTLKMRTMYAAARCNDADATLDDLRETVIAGMSSSTASLKSLSASTCCNKCARCGSVKLLRTSQASTSAVHSAWLMVLRTGLRRLRLAPLLGRADGSYDVKTARPAPESGLR